MHHPAGHGVKALPQGTKVPPLITDALAGDNDNFFWPGSDALCRARARCQGRWRADLRRGHVRCAARPARRADRGLAVGAGGGRTVAVARLRGKRQARSRGRLAVGDQGGTRCLRPFLRAGQARAVASRAHPRGRGGADRTRVDPRLPRRGRVLALRAADQVTAPDRHAAAPAGRGGALAGRRACRLAGRLGRRMLGGRGGAFREDRGADGLDHAGDPDQDGRLRLPGRGGHGARTAAAAREGALPVLPRRARHGAAGSRDARAARGAGRGPRPARGRAAGRDRAPRLTCTGQQEIPHPAGRCRHEPARCELLHAAAGDAAGGAPAGPPGDSA